MPDLLLIDGGRGQLARVRAVLQDLGFADLPVVAVAKGEGRRAGARAAVPPGEAAGRSICRPIRRRCT